ncbi:MAG TPA: FAD-dependent oxidoreductase [Candidatus Limnocylindria bacterium]|jgi:4-methylaminobutanoate oxidase (formaldehyde-forming)|nr:FAD-dependent oxidoreductase [Candidatus Limnocylindria bacterium]
MVEQARVVVIGGGITGVSVALHLARAGWREIVLLEKGVLTSGATSQAAGVVTAFNPSAAMMSFRRYSIDLYREFDVFETVGSIRIASSREQWRELQRGASRARGIGLEVELLGPRETLRLLPEASPADLHGSVWLAGDGYLDPHGATYAVAAAARALGVTIETGVRVVAIELGSRHEVKAVVTDRGRIVCEEVVNAAGMWAPRVAAMVGSWLASTAVDHQHIALRAVDGHALPPDMPCFRDPDNLVYGKAEQGGMLFGGYEAEPHARWLDGAPWEHGSRSLPPDWVRFEPLMAGAIRRFPFLADAEAIRLVNHPDAMTPDANPLLGPMPGVHGFWVAAGLSLNGFGGAGGIGRAIAGWMTADDPGVDIHPYRAWRFGATYRDPRYVAETAREAYRYYYRLRYPYDSDTAGRPRRLSPLHTRLEDAGAVFGTKHGWERADYLEPSTPWRMAGEDQRTYGWSRPPWLDLVGEEHRAVRERAGLIDLTSFGKIDVSGPGALGLLQRVSVADVDRPVGTVVYTQWLDDRAGMVADVTVVRLAADRFRVVTGAGYVASDLGWLLLHVREGEEVALRDVSEELACLGLWGPRARDIFAAVTDDDVSSGGIPLRTARPVRVGGGDVLAQRISYAGELGWELYVEPSWAVQLWDRLMDAGVEHGLAVFGYRALDSLRMEKGYRYYGTDLTMAETPLEAGLGRFVAWDKPDFVGRDALAAHRDAGPPAVRIRSVLVGPGPSDEDDDGWLPVYGGEAVRFEDEPAGRLRSVGYGHSLRRVIGYVYLPTHVAEGSEVEIEILGQATSATVVPDALVDPKGDRMRG